MVKERFRAGEIAVLCQFFQTFPSNCFPEATKDFDIYLFLYITSFWSEFLVNESLIIKESPEHHLSFATIQAEFLFLKR
jgi:hypothetical protein